MEEALQGHLMDFVMTVLGAAIFALIGFVWRISHKVAENAKRIDTISDMSRRDVQELNKDIDMLMGKVDKHGEWTTNRMMSIAKDMNK